MYHLSKPHVNTIQTSAASQKARPNFSETFNCDQLLLFFMKRWNILLLYSDVLYRSTVNEALADEIAKHPVLDFSKIWIANEHLPSY